MKKALNGFLSAFGVVAYIVIIAGFFSNAQAIFGNQKSFLIPVFMLLLFVISASITGSLVLGKPILLYLDGKKKEAIILLAQTVGWLVVFLFIVAIILILL